LLLQAEPLAAARPGAVPASSTREEAKGASCAFALSLASRIGTRACGGPCPGLRRRDPPL